MPRTHSDILWHFTGGPKWNERQGKQSDRKKTLEASYDAFCSILQSKELRVGGYHELIRIKVPKSYEYQKGIKELKKFQNVYRTIKTSKVCCVADIQLPDLFHHAKRYGTIAIGFKRESLVNNGFNPVFYTLDDMNIVQNFFNAQNALESVDDSASDLIDSIQSEVDSIFSEHEIDEYIDVSEAIEATSEATGLAEEALLELEQAMAFIKTFNRNEFDSIYSEREWRSVNNYNFKYSDIEKLVLPSKGNYYEKFVAEKLEALKIPKRIEIIAWNK